MAKYQVVTVIIRSRVEPGGTFERKLFLQTLGYFFIGPGGRRGFVGHCRFLQIGVSGAGFVDQSVNCVIKTALTVELSVGLLVQRTVGFVAEALQFFGQIASLQVNTAFGSLTDRLAVHSRYYRQLRPSG